MNETFDDKTLMQYAMSSSPYLGIYCKTKQIACISCLTSTDTQLFLAHTIKYVMSRRVEYFQLTQVRKQVYFLMVIPNL